ncbi:MULTISPECIES: Rne/Rng family ribonuclease [Algibacter]|jgi:ribonuclease G|uniref:Ribonuclease G n=2 Tax=Algibacter lectus TaxID=221126 RepID=A0A090W011_9FLAO|nr:MULTISPECIES: ribonuclease E/G [Algibacter]MDO7137386.1 ribonuclease E/G [Algibacter lectus]MWW24116.1 Rne/Rng family ribonuclease [Algibacter lectus]TDY62133.1 ribonuclease G [Algibacter lectus]SFC76346.1 ribonuclease G [Algibacter lectus]GAL60867.1 cytoplasmic axial filament protein CafA and ribonuclease G [Algibacter lectus]
MDKELIIRSSSEHVDFALLKDGKLIELQKDEDGNNFSVGDVFIAKIRKTVPGLNASFVNVGYEKDAFLHYHDLGPKLPSLLKFTKRVSTGKLKDFSLKNFPFEKDIDKDGKIVDALKSNQSLLVQIVKEPISTKGPRISSELSIAGRYIVLVPFSNRISISQKIEDREEKDRLKRLVKSITPPGFGIIVRTVAQGKKVAELDKDLQTLLGRWTAMCKKLPKAQHPSKVLGEMNKASSILRDIFNDTFTGITVDDETLFDQIKDYLQEIAPKKESIVKLHQSKTPIFEKFGIERQIKTSFGKTVSMAKGAYLVIEHTEALHVIDVNSGNRSNKANSQEDTALEVNLIAATEMARQLRLRDMGGIIVVDFIDMTNAENRQKLFNHLRDEMKDDRAKHKILPPSKFGLIQITRQRVRPEMNIKTREENPDVIINGSEVEAPIGIVEKITHDLERLIKKDYKKLTLNTHPFIAAFITKGFPSMRSKWFFEHKKWVKILPRDAYTYLEYHFFDEDGNQIK